MPTFIYKEQLDISKERPGFSLISQLTGSSVSEVICCDSACSSISGESSTILWTDIWINSSNESNCCLTRPFSSKYELMTIQHASCHRSGVISSPSSSPYAPSQVEKINIETYYPEVKIIGYTCTSELP